MGFISPKSILKNAKDTLFGPLYEQEPVICGLDEAGRGPWAGPVVACALVFKKGNIRLPGLKDSKKLSAAQRESMYQKIARQSHFGIGRAEANEIDTLGLLKATKLAYERALLNLTKSSPGELYLLIDGRDKFNLPYPTTSIIKGDEKVKIIACASIMAKVERDKIMCRLAKKYEQYGFELHKGYGTALHQKALKKNGVCKEHRMSYKPIAIHLK